MVENTLDAPPETGDNPAANGSASAAQKTEMNETVKKLILERVDISSNKVTNVLAVGNEYAIYEIDAEDIGDKLKVFIDGFSDASEKVMIDKFAKVKAKYTEAKGLLYRSRNFGNMKNRIAHTLSSILILDDIDGNKEFQNLIDEVKRENRNTILKKIFHVWPSFLFFMVISAICVCGEVWKLPRNSYEIRIYVILLSASLGGAMSILYGLSKIRFDEVASIWWYIASGLERVFLSIVASTAAFIFLQSKIVFQSTIENNFWAVMAILIVASFSETLIPSMLGKIEKKV